MITKMSQGQHHPVTEAEALQYDKESLEANIEKIQQNIELFQTTIAQEEEKIERYKQMIWIIENHNKNS